jgi:hypothetical protein
MYRVDKSDGQKRKNVGSVKCPVCSQQFVFDKLIKVATSRTYLGNPSDTPFVKLTLPSRASIFRFVVCCTYVHTSGLVQMAEACTARAVEHDTSLLYKLPAMMLLNSVFLLLQNRNCGLLVFLSVMDTVQ